MTLWLYAILAAPPGGGAEVDGPDRGRRRQDVANGELVKEGGARVDSPDEERRAQGAAHGELVNDGGAGGAGGAGESGRVRASGGLVSGPARGGNGGLVKGGAAEPAGQETGGGGAAPPATTASADLGTGLAGEPLELLPCGGLWVAAGRLESPPAAAEPALRAHDAVVRRLQEVSRALLPIRFGQTVPDEAALAELLAPRQPVLARALEEVAGCRQMTLRVLAPAGQAAARAGSDVSAETPAAASGAGRPPFGVSVPSDVSAETSTAASAANRAFGVSAPPDVSAETSVTVPGADRPPFDVSAPADVSAETSIAIPGPGRPSFDVSASSDVSAETSTAAGPGRGGPDVSAETSAASPGTRYLAERREAARRRRSLPEIAPLLAELAPLVRAERIERGGPPPLVGSAYHLVPAERAGEWVARLESAVAALAAAAPAPGHDAPGTSPPGPGATGSSTQGRSVTGPPVTGPSDAGPSAAEPVRGLAAPVPRLAWSGPFPPWAFAPELA